MLVILFSKFQLPEALFWIFLTNLLSTWTTGPRREIWLENVLGRPDFRAEEEEHDKGFGREPVMGCSDAEKGRGIISRVAVTVTLPTQNTPM